MILPGVRAFGATMAGGPRFGDLITAVRRLIDTVCVSDPHEDDVDQAIADLDRMTAYLEAHEAGAGLRPAGHRWDLPGRGHPLLVPLQVKHLSDLELSGHVRFSRAHMAHPGIAHGGFVPLVFDEALGVFATRFDPPPRTASLTVQYRAGTPVEVDVEVRCCLTRHEGRKLFVAGDLRYQGRLLAEAEALFVKPRPSPDPC